VAGRGSSDRRLPPVGRERAEAAPPP